MLDWLQGRKTYGVAAALVAYVIVTAVGGYEFDQRIVDCLLATGFVTIRAGIGKVEATE